ncbi:MAG TPA: sulfite exporter TauE/SafE family protein, partial [Acidimicrobiia bacterium]
QARRLWVGSAVSLLAGSVSGLLGVGAGWLGALIGIGGGVVIVPVLVLLFGVDIRVAVAASLVAVIATSTSAGSVYLGRGLTNMRLGMTLEVATTIGGLTGGLAAALLPVDVIAALFALVMGIASVLVLRGASRPPQRRVEPVSGRAAGWEEPGSLAGAYFDEARGGMVRYQARRLWVGSAVSLLAGSVSGLLGVGGGFLKVPAMNLGMNVPVKVAAATSNFMIGVTAAASVFIYFQHGYVEPLVAVPITLGVVAGSLVATRMAGSAPAPMVKRILAVVLVAVALQMALRAVGVGFGG